MLSHIKRALGSASVLVIVTLMIPTAIAQAAPHWWKAGVKLPETGAETAITSLTKNLLLNEKHKKIISSCEIKDKGDIWNPKGGLSGEDKITLVSILNNPCPTNKSPCKTKVTVEGLPWKGQLAETGGVVRNDLKEVRLKLKFEGALCTILNQMVTVVGELSPKVVNGTTGSEAGCSGATLTNTRLEFDAESGVLMKEPMKEEEKLAPELNFEGVDCIWAEAGETVTVANP